MQGSGRKAALTSSLRGVFEAALFRCEALAFLPLYLFPGRENDLELARKTWQEALTEGFPEDTPAPDCRLLPDTVEPLADRILTLFENEPTMPAMWLLGADSSLSDVPQSIDDGAGIKPGHAVAALILSRPNLFLSEMDTIEKPDLSNPLLPHWEREQGYKEAPQWGNVPPGLRRQLWDLSPFAALHRSRVVSLEGSENRMPRMTRLFQGLIENVLIDAALHDPPPHDGSPAKEPDPLDLGNLFHNFGSGEDRITVRREASILSVLYDYDCPMDTASNVCAEHGDTGAACPVLMLTEAAMCAAITQLPVIVADLEGADSVCIGLVRSVA